MEGRQFFDLNSTPEMTMSEEEDTYDHQPKRKRYDDQIQGVLEAFFEECTHPNETQRRALSQKLGMEVRHVKFWFQNKRARMKSQNMREVKSQLKRENEELRQQNMRYKETLDNSSCATCVASMKRIFFNEHQIRMENARIREENESVAAMVSNNTGKPLPLLNSGEASSFMAPPQQPPPSKIQ